MQTVKEKLDRENKVGVIYHTLTQSLQHPFSNLHYLQLPTSSSKCLKAKNQNWNHPRKSLPGAGSTARSIIGCSFTAQPVPIKICGGVVDSETFLVTLAYFGENINPVLGLNTIICLDVQNSFRLNYLEHLKGRKTCMWRREEQIIYKQGLLKSNVYRQRDIFKILIGSLGSDPNQTMRL